MGKANLFAELVWWILRIKSEIKKNEAKPSKAFAQSSAEDWERVAKIGVADINKYLCETQ